MLLILIICAIVTGLYFLNLNNKYWEKRGVPGPKPILFIGNLLDNFLMKKSLAEVCGDIYNDFPNASIVGFFRSSTPSLIIRDPNLIKELTVKSFQHFHDNDLFIDKKVDPLAGRHPFFLRGEEWKNTRTLLTPGFSSAKIKLMHSMVEDVSQRFVKYIANKPSQWNAKELSMRFTLNNVGICAFGLDAKCFEEENPEFKQIADKFLVPEGFQNLKMFLVSLIPLLSKLISVRFTPKHIEDKVLNIVRQTVEYREKNNILRNDFFHIMHQLTKSSKDFSIIDLTAHVGGFFGDGYETSSVAMLFMLYELAANPKVQAKLREEINAVFEKNGDTLPYEALQNLPYLDAVFKESLRMHPPLGNLSKICTKTYTYIPPSDCMIKKPVQIEPGTPVIIPLYGLQRDPKYFHDPDCFQPERFLDTDKEITKFTYLPFGEGPRACLGQRFGSLQVKIGVAYVVRNFIVTVNTKTEVPIRYEPSYILTLTKSGLWLDFQKIL